MGEKEARKCANGSLFNSWDAGGKPRHLATLSFRLVYEAKPAISIIIILVTSGRVTHVTLGGRWHRTRTPSKEARTSLLFAFDFAPLSSQREPLMWAVKHGNAVTARAILKYEVDPAVLLLRDAMRTLVRIGLLFCTL